MITSAEKEGPQTVRRWQLLDTTISHGKHCLHWDLHNDARDERLPIWGFVEDHEVVLRMCREGSHSIFTAEWDEMRP